MKRIYGVLIILSFIFSMISGCGKEDIDIKEGAYVAQGDFSNHFASYSPTLLIDMQERLFRFTWDPLSSYLNTGTIEIEDNTIIARTYDKRYSFVFHIESQSELKFVQKGSSIIKTVGGNFPIVDGTLFKYKNE